MNNQHPHGARAWATSANAPLKFLAGDYEFAHWFSNIGDGPHSLFSGAFSLEAGNGSRWLAYCLHVKSDFDTERNYLGFPVARDDFSCDNRFSDADDFARLKTQSAVAWIARNTFPAVSLDHLANVADAPGLTREEAIAATQASIWSLTNEVVFAGLVETDFGATKRALQVMEYLLGPQNMGVSERDFAAGKLTPGAVIRLQTVGDHDLAVAEGSTAPEASAAPAEYFFVLSGVDPLAGSGVNEDDFPQQAVA